MTLTRAMRPIVGFLVFLGVARTVYGDCPKPPGRGEENMVLITDVTFPAPEGTSVSYSCQVGYRPVGGSRAIVCSSGQWTKLMMKCEIKNCGSAGEVLNGYIDYSGGTEFGSTIRVICNDGYTLVGADKTLYCGDKGWQGRLPVCEVTICEPPNQITNGYFSPDKDEYQHSEVVTYSCEGQYIINGSKTVTCSNDGQFKPAPPKCVLVECQQPQIESGVVASGSRPPYKHLTSVVFRCNVGFDMVGSDTVSCDINSKWSPTLPKCNPIECKVPEIVNGKVEDSRLVYKFAETVTVKCSEGYKLTGDSKLTCGAKNQWSGTLPECNLIQCTPPKVEGGVLEVDPSPPYKYKDSVVFKCESGHIMKGEDIVTCDENSQWSPKLPECTPLENNGYKIAIGVCAAAVGFAVIGFCIYRRQQKKKTG